MLAPTPLRSRFLKHRLRSVGRRKRLPHIDSEQ
jgi:hypothetical protein